MRWNANFAPVPNSMVPGPICKKRGIKTRIPQKKGLGLKCEHVFTTNCIITHMCIHIFMPYATMFHIHPNISRQMFPSLHIHIGYMYTYIHVSVSIVYYILVYKTIHIHKLHTMDMYIYKHHIYPHISIGTHMYPNVSRHRKYSYM